MNYMEGGGQQIEREIVSVQKMGKHIKLTTQGAASERGSCTNPRKQERSIPDSLAFIRCTEKSKRNMITKIEDKRMNESESLSQKSLPARYISDIRSTPNAEAKIE